MHNRVQIQQECIEYICDILGPEVYEAFEGAGTRTRLQYALEKNTKGYISSWQAWHNEDLVVSFLEIRRDTSHERRTALQAHAYKSY